MEQTTTAFPLMLSLMVASAGVMFLASVQVGIISFFTQKAKLYLSFSVMALAVGVYQLGQSYSLYSAELDSALIGLKWQTGAILLFYPAMFLFFACYTQQKAITPWFQLILLISTLGFLANLFSPYSLRFEQISHLTRYTLPYGETIHLINGKQHFLGQSLHLFGQGLMLWLFYRSYCLYRQRRALSAAMLAIYLLLQLSGSAYGALIDAGEIEGLYISGFIFTLLILLMTLSMAYDFKVQNHLLKERTEALADAVLRQKEAESYNKKWAQVLHQAPVATVILSPKGEIITSNQACIDFWGKALKQQPEADFLALLEITPEQLNQAFCHSVHNEEQKTLTLKFTKGQTQYGLSAQKDAWLQFNIYPVKDEQGQLSEVVISHSDVTEQENAKQAIENIAAGVSSSSGREFFDQLVLHIGQLFKARYAFIGLLNQDNPDEKTIRTLSICSNNEIVENITYALKDTPCDNVMGQDICIHACDVQQLYPKDFLLQEMGIEGYIGAPIFEPDGTPLGVMVILDTKPLEHTQQATSILEIFAARAGAELQRLNAEAQMRQMAYEDYLTQLPNRAQMHEHLHDVLAQSRKEGTQAAMYLIDLDHFKTVNDALGHDVGDEIIRKMGERLRQQLASNLFIARVGGDEFVVIDQQDGDVTPLDIKLLADRLLHLLMQPLQVGERILNIGGSIGAVVFPVDPEHQETELDLLRYADIALYQAKSSGRDNYVLFEPRLQQRVNDRLEIERGLREALENDYLKLYLQPQVTKEGRVVGAEVLLRWLHPEQGLIPPFRFIPVAEETGLILRLGHWVMDHSFQLIAQWQQQQLDYPPQISINISAWQFAQQDFIDQVKSLIQQRQIDPALIILEVTETALLTDIAETRLKLEQLREQGFKISLDDFGTGYSSLAYLKDLPLDELKIDKTFIDEVKPGEKQPLVESMLAIGKHMQLSVIAEGVESKEQCEQLSLMGCQHFQGYYFARPMPAEELPEWLAKQSSKVTES